VPDKPKTQHRSVRIDDPEWDDGEQATGHMGTDRAKVINQLWKWYLRRPGAKLPQRPSADVMAEIVARREEKQRQSGEKVGKRSRTGPDEPR
jgi:hypothetical protein